MQPVNERARTYLIHKLRASTEQVAEYDGIVAALGDDADDRVDAAWTRDPETADEFLDFLRAAG